MIQAVIFDMDGVLVDTEEYICEAAMKMFEEMGVTGQSRRLFGFCRHR